MGSASRPQPAAAEPVGPVEVFSLSFGTIVGVVWLFLFSTWLRAAGPIGTALAILAGALAMLPIALCYTRIVRRFPGGGGEIRYALECFGQPGAFLAAWLLFMAYTALASFCLPLFQWLVEVTLRVAGGGLLSDSTVRVAALIATWGTFAGIVFANYRGIEAAAWLQNLTVALLILLSVALGVTATIVGRGEHLRPYLGDPVPGGPWRGLAVVLATTPFLFAGFNTALQALGDARQGGADRATTRALLGSVIGAAAFYALLIVAVPAALRREQLLALELPALEAIGVALGSSWVVAATGALAGLALVTSWNAVFFAATRVFGILVLSGALAGRVGRPPGRAGPIAAIALGSALVSFAGRTAVGTIVTFVSLCMTLVFLLVSSGLLRIEWEHGTEAGTRRALMPALAVVLSTGLAVLGLTELPRSWAASPLGGAIVVGWLVAGAGLAITRLGSGRGGLDFRRALIPHVGDA